jgi:hypothetical protein
MSVPARQGEKARAKTNQDFWICDTIRSIAFRQLVLICEAVNKNFEAIGSADPVPHCAQADKRGKRCQGVGEAIRRAI